MSYAIIIFSFNTENPDLFNYSYHYMNGGRGMEPIYSLLETLFRTVGVDYIVLRTALCIFGLILLTKAFWDLSPYPNVLFSLYLFYPFPLDVIQVRSFVANSLIVFAMRYIIFYLKNKDKKNILIFVVLVLAATGFHYVSILFAILGVAFLNKKGKFVVIMLTIFSMIVIFGNVELFELIVESITGSKYESGYVSAYRIVSFVQLLRLVFSRGLILIMLWIWQKVSLTSTAGAEQFDDRLNNRKTNYWLFQSILLISLYTIIEILFGGDFERINRVAIIYSMLLVTRQVQFSGNKNKFLIWSVSIMAFALNFLSVMLGKFTSNGAYLNTVFRTVFENNLIFRF